MFLALLCPAGIKRVGGRWNCVIPLSTEHKLSAFAGSIQNKITLCNYSDIYFYIFCVSESNILIVSSASRTDKLWRSRASSIDELDFDGFFPDCNVLDIVRIIYWHEFCNITIQLHTQKLNLTHESSLTFQLNLTDESSSTFQLNLTDESLSINIPTLLNTQKLVDIPT